VVVDHLRRDGDRVGVKEYLKHHVVVPRHPVGASSHGQRHPAGDLAVAGCGRPAAQPPCDDAAARDHRERDRRGPERAADQLGRVGSARGRAGQLRDPDQDEDELMLPSPVTDAHQETNSGSNIEPIDGETIGTGSEDVDVGSVSTDSQNGIEYISPNDDIDTRVDSAGLYCLTDGTHSITSPITVPSGARIFGFSRINTVVQADASIGAMFRTETNANDITLANLTINGNGANASLAVNLSESSSYVSRNNLIRVKMTDCTNLVDATNQEDILIDRCYFQDFHNEGLLVGATQGQINVSNSLFGWNNVSGSRACRFDAGKINMESTALEGNKSVDPSNEILNLGVCRFTADRTWVYSEACPNVRVTANNGRYDFDSSEMYLTSGSSVGANIVGKSTATKIDFDGGEIKNQGSGTLNFDVPITDLFTFGTVVQDGVNSADVTTSHRVDTDTAEI